MTRWEPNARGRLREAALELFEEHGFEQTTVEDIATRAGLTKRTFFRHYADKREVLFADDGAFQALFLDGLERAGAGAAPLDAVRASLVAVAEGFPATREQAQRRAVVVASNPGLQERELVKLASVATAFAAALRERGIEEPTATVTAQTAIAIFRAAFERWVTDDDERSLTERVEESLDTLRAVAGI